MPYDISNLPEPTSARVHKLLQSILSRPSARLITSLLNCDMEAGYTAAQKTHKCCGDESWSVCAVRGTEALRPALDQWTHTVVICWQGWGGWLAVGSVLQVW